MIRKDQKCCIFLWEVWHYIRVKDAHHRLGACSKRFNACFKYSSTVLSDGILRFCTAQNMFLGYRWGYKYLKIIIGAMKNLIAPLDSARRVVLIKGTGTVGRAC